MARILLVVAWVVVFVAGCGDEGMSVSDAGADAECLAGSLDCVCAEEGVCTRGQCVGDVCTLCTRGDEGCLCRRDGTCGSGAVCSDAICTACPSGETGCPCERGACAEGNTCMDGVCVGAACPPGTDGCACRVRSAPACDGSLVCLGDGQCHGCNADRPGCPCDDGACSAGLTCELGLCQAPPTCEDLVMEGLCGPAERCEVGPGGAECFSGECMAGFVFFEGECIEGEPNCRAGEPGSLVGACAEEGRSCIAEGGEARCGPCTGDTVEVDGVCQGPVACGEGFCASFEYCDRDGAEPFCAELPCPPGQARGSTGACTACGFVCRGEGLSGRVFPFRTRTDACVCETLPGFYMPPGGSTDPEPCDADGDGWVRAEVTENLIQVDPTLRQNARCDLTQVDGVILRDEHGLEVEVASCEQGLFVSPEAAACPFRVPMPLVESRRNDQPGPVGAGTVGAPAAYGARPLNGAEVNDLTKYCVDEASDFNDNGVDDILEIQANGDTLGSADGRTRLQSFAHFVELHRAYVSPAAGGEFDKLVIEERFRCDPRDFPLRYDPSVVPTSPTDGYEADDGATYWRSCQRGVDPAFVPGVASLGQDFAQWSCPDGVCQGIPDGPPDDRADLLENPLPFGEAPPVGATLCELGARFPADGLWRGMHHHSQFKCVAAGGTGPASVPLGSVNGGGLRLNACTALACDGGDASCVGARPVSPSGGAIEPVLHCRALGSVDEPAVGFAAVEYRPYGGRFETAGGGNANYRGGCVNEDVEFAAHYCPGPVFQTFSEVDAFGRETCFVAPCPLGQADCDGNEFNGCEMEARSLTDCNGCSVPCSLSHATETCEEGFCQVVECDPSYGDCDGNPDNGCETLLRNNDDCAACGRRCEGGPGVETSCASGACLVVSCPEGQADCDGDAGNGCETSLRTDDHCGGCDVACAPENSAAATCSSGTCEILACVPGRGDCDGDSGNGCEVDLRTSVEHCGLCSTPEHSTSCSAEHASAACVMGVCGVGTCDPGYDDCDGLSSTGCETSTLSDLTNCGGCFERCDIPNASEVCFEGSCDLLSCDDARSDCDPEMAGCETRHDVLTGACGSGEDLGSSGGDIQCPNGFLGTCIGNDGWDELTVRRGTASSWFRARAVEASPCSADIEHRIRLIVPAGVNYDLKVQQDCASGSAVQVSSNGTGTNEAITIARGDAGGRDNSFNYNILVEYVNGAACAEWELIVEGHGC